MAEKNSFPASLPGYGLLVLALALLFGQAAGRKGAEKTINSGQESATSSGAQPPPNPSDPSPSPPFPGHLRFLLKKRVFSLVGWVPVLRPEPDVRFLILTLPDPIDCQFGYWYDQCLDALNRAMVDLDQDSKEVYTLADKWFPWTVGTDDKGKPSGIRTGESKTEPAVLVYQKTSNKQDRVVVLVVGENPTTGLRIEVLKAALDLAAIAPASSSGDQSIPLVGPSFSGSQATLGRAVLEWSDEWSKRKEGTSLPKIRCVSGIALGIKPWKDILPAFADQLNERFHPIAGTQVPFAILHHEALRYLSRLGRTPPPANEEGPLDLSGKVAYLVEANSGLGESAVQAIEKRGLIFRFPIHIGRLASLRSKEDRERDERLGLIRPGEGLLSALDASRTGGDLIPAVDEARTALLNQRLLADYWSTIRREQVKFVWVVATDKRDTLFLLEQLQMACPRVRPVVLGGADMHYVYPDYLPYTRGVIMVGTYPLIHPAQRWQFSKNDPRRMPLPSSSAEGVYNAVLAVLGKTHRMADYSPPRFNPQGKPQPPIWVTTVGENGEFIPLAYTTDYDDENHFLVPPPNLCDKPTGPGSPFERPFLYLTVVIVAVAVCAICWVWRVDRQIRKALRQPRDKVRDRPVVDEVLVVGLRAKYVGIAGIGGVFAVLPRVLGLGSADLGGDFWTKAHLVLAVIILVLLAIGTFGYVLWQVWQVWIVVKLAKKDVSRAAVLSPWQVLALAVLIAGLVFGWLFADHARLLEDERFLFAERAAAVSSGCSPVVPASVIALGLLGYGLFGLQRVRFMVVFHINPPYPSGREITQRMVATAVGQIHLAVEEIRTRLSTLFGMFATPGWPSCVVARFLFRHRAWAVARFLVRLLVWARARFLFQLLFWVPAVAVAVWVIFTAGQMKADRPCLLDLGLAVAAVTVSLVLLLLVLLVLFFFWRHVRRTRLGCPQLASCLLLSTFAGACAVDLSQAQPTWESRAWNCLFASGFLALAFLTLIAGYRLYLLWKQVEKMTQAIMVIPMVGAFDRFPDKLSRVFGEYLLSDRHRSLDLAIPFQLLGRLRADLADDSSLEAEERLKVLDLVQKSRDEVQQSLGPTRTTPNGDSTEEMEGQQTDSLCQTASRLVEVLAPGWGKLGIIEAFGKVPVEPDEDPPETTGWRDTAQEFVAVMAVIFLSQYFIRMRYLAYSAMATSGTLLLAITAYQFEPELFLMYTAVGFAGAVIGLLLWVLYRINRNDLVSRVTRSTPNKFQLNTSFVQNVVVFVLPLAVLVATQVAGRTRGIVEPILSLFR